MGSVRQVLKGIRNRIRRGYAQIRLIGPGYRLKMTLEQAREILGAMSPMPAGTVDAENEISVQYDLMIVIPAYNAEAYICACINSVLSQKTKYSFEAVVVEDGSTDATRQILRQCEERKNDKNQAARDGWNPEGHLRVIYQENRGFSGARNRALEKITGKYLMFVDSDDILEQGAVEQLMDKAVAWGADIVEGSAVFVDIRGNILERMIHDDSQSEKDVKARFWGQPWAKVIRGELFARLKFPEGYWYEDSIFSYLIYSGAMKKYTISSVVYHYLKNVNGVTYGTKQAPKAVDTYWITEYLCQYLQTHGNRAQAEALQRQLICQAVLNFERTAPLGKNILKSGFVIMRECCLNVSCDKREGLQKKEQLLWDTIRNGDFGRYEILCRNWRYL